jgi:hypothetical protein
VTSAYGFEFSAVAPIDGTMEPSAKRGGFLGA